MLRSVTSIVGFDVAVVALMSLYDRGTASFSLVSWISRNLEFLGWLTLVPAVWVVIGGLLGDHLLARRGPWWAFLLHTVGLCVSATLILIVMAVVSVAHEGSPVAVLAIVWVIFIPVISIPGVALTWLIPGSFPRAVSTTPSDLATQYGTHEYVAPWQAMASSMPPPVSPPPPYGLPSVPPPPPYRPPSYVEPAYPASPPPDGGSHS